MAEPRSVVFLYREESVPDQIIEQARMKLPAGMALTLCGGKTPESDRKALVANADYLMAYGVGFDDLAEAGRARLFQVLSAGYDRLDLDAFARAGIPVANNGGANAPTVAEHAVLLMLSVFKKLPLHHAALNRGEWLGHREALRMRELRDKRVGIVGFGKIGQEVARIVGGFLAAPVYYDVQRASPAVERAFGVEQLALNDLLETSDVVTVHTPLTDGTRGLFGADAFARMKPGAILVNTSRGEVVDQAALVEALDTGGLAGAGLDVFEHEPMEQDNPLRNRENVVVTPHIGGTTIDTWTRRLDFAFANFQRVERGETALAVVGG